MPLSVTPLDRGDDGAMSDLIRIYQAAIERREQKPAEALRAMRDDPRYGLFVVKDGPSVAGFSIACFLETADLWLLEYMAIATERRSCGLGSRLFLETCAFARARAPSARCVLEVDRPLFNASPADVRVRRLDFYARHGCREIAPLEYVLPLDFAGTPPPMMLMLRGGHAGDEFGKETVTAWLRAIYREIYGVHASDPRFVTMVSPMPPSLRLV